MAVQNLRDGNKVEPITTDQALLSQQVTNRIRNLILSGELAPGSRIRQEELAARVGTSRIPVREALKRLESEGLVILVPNSSAWVAKLDLRECLESYKIRERLEPLAMIESVQRITDEQIADLERLVERIEICRDNEEFLLLDRQFHVACYAAADMPQLLALVERFWNTTQHYRRAYTGIVGPHGKWVIHYEHRLMMEAIKRRDGEEASTLLRSHIRRTRLELERNREIFATEPAPTKRRASRTRAR